jgi:hypothetical protein
MAIDPMGFSCFSDQMKAEKHEDASGCDDRLDERKAEIEGNVSDCGDRWGELHFISSEPV